MTKQILVPLALAGLVTLVAPPVQSSGSGSSSIPAARTTKRLTPEQRAQEKYHNGVKHLEKAMKLTAQLAEPDVKNRAKLEGKLHKRYEKAVKDFTKAVDQDPTLHAAFSNLGYALRKTGKYDDALVAYDRALALEAGYTPAIEYRAEAHLALDRLDEVKEAYMLLFDRDRERADELAAAMSHWVDERRDDPRTLSTETVAEFVSWVEKRTQLASQTSSLAQPRNGGW